MLWSGKPTDWAATYDYIIKLPGYQSHALAPDAVLTLYIKNRKIVVWPNEDIGQLIEARTG
jgi:hypothetical protein